METLPRMQGKHFPRKFFLTQNGNTPAYAGKTPKM